MRILPTYIKRYIFILTALLLSSHSLKAQKENNNIKEASINYVIRHDLPKVLNESSGLMFWNGKLWSHNDSSGADSIFSFSPSSPTDINSYWVGAPNKDWEAIDHDEHYVYIGDFGNNALGNRDNLRIFKIEKESLLSGSPVVDTIYFSYFDQTDYTPTEKPESTNFDCEAFVVTTDSIYLFTKEWLDKETTLHALPKIPGRYTAMYMGKYDIGGLVTDATYLPNKRILALCGYSTNYLKQFLYIFYDFENDNFFSGKKHKFTLNVGLVPHQIEGMATLDGNTYYFTNEYKSVSPQRLHVFDVSEYFKNYMRLPETALKINGEKEVCKGSSSIVYSVEPIANADYYEWVLDDGIIGNSTTNSISVSFDTLSAYHEIKVRGINSYGSGGFKSIIIKTSPKPIPPVITIIDYKTKKLYSSSPTGNQWYNHNGAIQNATSQHYQVKEYGEYYVKIFKNGCVSKKSNIIITDCYLKLDPIPTLRTEQIKKTTNTDLLHDKIKKITKKKIRKFLFWKLK